MTTIYTTESGSVYVLQDIDGYRTVLRRKLGARHTAGGPNAKRSRDGVDGTWRVVSTWMCGGVGDIIRVGFADKTDAGDKLYTSRVTKIEVV